MPYRRLPNTDAARIRALQVALAKGKELPPQKLAYSPKTMVHIQKFLPAFENNIQLQRQSASIQNKRSREYNETVRKARLYLTHFIRVMNMAIFRGDLPPETRAYYGLEIKESTVPSLNTDNELISWARRIIEGEEFRIRKVGSPITNPTIAVVKVRFEKFLEAYNHHKALMRKTQDYSEKTSDMRKEADDLIAGIWNEVEATFSSLPDDVKRKDCEAYGLIYFFRKSEIEKAKKKDTQLQTSV